jgi:uncharacterized protein (TIGR01777 family)
VIVVLAGASGLIGSALSRSLTGNGHSVRTLVRRASTGVDEFTWDPEHGRVPGEALAGAHAVVCLSGAGVGDHRWTAAYKRQIVESRVRAVGTLAEAMAAHGGPPVLLAASAVGYYGDAGQQIIDESAPPGDTFLSEVCVQWEAAADPARAAGVRVTHLRTGLVLSGEGGLLKRLAPIVRAGVAGRLGDGRQFMPWISITDEVRAITFLLEHDLTGPVNLTGPAPVRNVEFTKTLGAVLHRPTVLPVPGFAARIALGQFSEDVLTGQRAMPARLTEAGFEFVHADLRAALEDTLRR